MVSVLISSKPILSQQETWLIYDISRVLEAGRNPAREYPCQSIEIGEYVLSYVLNSITASTILFTQARSFSYSQQRRVPGDVYDRQTGVGEGIGARCAKCALRDICGPLKTTFGA